MAPILGHALSHIVLILIIGFLVIPSSCFNPKKLVNVTSYSSSHSDWSSSVATWYGDANGDGSEAGACGYGNAVGEPPFFSMISAGSPLIYNLGKGCGSCYEVKCTENSACPGNPVSVVITDECAECGSDAQYHFDLSGTAFSSMAISGRNEELRYAGKLAIQHRRVACNYPDMSVAFHVDDGSNQEYFAILIEYVNGDGDLNKVELMEGIESASWNTMKQSWGALWKLSKGAPFKAPFSIKLTTLESGKTFVAHNVIPLDWEPGQTYSSVGNF
ncbi:expansin [Trifolium repens]|nr:expansin [Trifolium repens]